MSNTKISALPSATTPLAGTEVLPIVQSGATDQVTVANLTVGRAVSALSFSSATIGAPASTTLNLQANGTTYATILGAGTTNGNFGVGTTSPAAKFHVSGSFRVGTASDYFQVNQVNTNLWAFINNPAAGYSIVMNTATANVGINAAGSSPDASAILDVQSLSKGMRMPNMSTGQKNAISSPAAGLMVFDTTLAKLCVYSGSAWQTITSI